MDYLDSETLKRVVQRIKDEEAAYVVVQKRPDLARYLSDNVFLSLVTHHSDLWDLLDPSDRDRFLLLRLSRATADDIFRVCDDLPLRFYCEVYRRVVELFGDDWFDSFVASGKLSNVDLAFLIGLYRVSLESKIVLGKLADKLRSKELRVIADYIFNNAELDSETLLELLRVYPHFALWLRDDDLLKLLDHIGFLLENVPELIDVYLSKGGEISIRTLLWLRDRVTSGAITVHEAVRLILKNPSPFSTVEFRKAKNVEDFNEALRKIGVSQ